MIDAHDNVLLHGEYLDAALELAEIAETKRVLNARESACKTLLEEVLSVGERGVDKDNIPIVAVLPGAARFSPERAAQVLPEQVLQSISSFRADGQLAHRMLSVAMYEECLEYNKASVVAL